MVEPASPAGVSLGVNTPVVRTARSGPGVLDARRGAAPHDGGGLRVRSPRWPSPRQCP